MDIPVVDTARTTSRACEASSAVRNSELLVSLCKAHSAVSLGEVNSGSGSCSDKEESGRNSLKDEHLFICEEDNLSEDSIVSVSMLFCTDIEFNEEMG